MSMCDTHIRSRQWLKFQDDVVSTREKLSMQLYIDLGITVPIFVKRELSQEDECSLKRVLMKALLGLNVPLENQLRRLAQKTRV
jgi:hypothetical protein